MAVKSINPAADVQHGKFLTRATEVWQSQKNVENPDEMHQAILMMGGVTTLVPRVSRTHQNQLFFFFRRVVLGFFFKYRAELRRMEGVIEQKVWAGWQEPFWQEHISAMPGRGRFSQIVWEMVEPKGKLLLAG